MNSLLCHIGIHNMYWSAYVDKSGYLLSEYTCKRCHRKWQQSKVPRSHKIWLALKNLVREVFSS